MLSIFGFRTRVRSFGETLFLTCDICHNSGFFRLYRRKVYFALFSMPIFLLKDQYYLACANCSNEIKLVGKDIEKAKAINALTQDFINEKISEECYLEKIKLIKLSIQMNSQECEFPKRFEREENVIYILNRPQYNVK